MKKRILSILLTICMVLMLVPITVFAADEVGDEREFHNLIKSTDAGKTLKMNKDYSCAMAFRIGKNMTIDLNGHVLSFSGRNAQTEIGYEDYKNKTVTIIDSNPNSVHSGQFAGLPNGGVIYAPEAVQGVLRIAEGSTLNMKGGTIYQSNAVNKGGAFVVYGTLNMTGGTIKNCTAGHGGGVHVQPGGTFTMSGGTIENCSSLERGGAVYNEGTFTMNGGTIDNCSTTIFGGGVYNCDNGKATLGGGTIKNCSADYGGGVFVQYGEFTMNGGTIEKCTAKTSEGSYGFGGGVNIHYANFTMTDGTIKDCTATYGESGALCLFANSTMTANGGSIQGTTVVDSLDGTISKIQTTSSDSYTKFYGKIVNEGIISGGAYYGDIQNRYNGTVSGTCYTVSFNLNGGSGSISPQRFVNISTASALRPTNPTRSGYKFMGWYFGSTKYTFTEPVTQSITLTAKWINTNVSTEAELKEAVDAGVPSIKLVDDITVSNTLDLSDKDITLDLNGHILTGDIKLSDTIMPINPSKLTLIDSNPTATHTNSNLPLGGVLDGKITLDKQGLSRLSRLCANGGTVKGQVILDDSNTQIVCTSTTPTAFMGSVGGSGAIHGGIFYGSIKESCIKEKTVTFMNGGQRYAVGVVASGNFAVAPIEPVKDGYVFAGWYFGNTKYGFTQPVMLDVVLNAKWVNEVTDEETLRTAINEGITNIKLMDDINLSRALDLSNKNITIDLNGYVISGADISINAGNGKANLTLKDSRPTATHTDSTLPKGGVVKSKISMKKDGGSYNDCVLYANGGTVTSDFYTNTHIVSIKCTSNTPTAFTGNISGYVHLYGGIYYGSIASSVTIEAKKITFKNGNNTYAYEVVDTGNKTVTPINPPIKEGYNGFDGWYNGDTKYTFGSTLSEDITLTAKFSNPKTYNISYKLDGGTATNPATYTVESEDITLNNPKKTGYTFTGWSGTGLTGENYMTVTIAKGSKGDRTYTAHFSQNNYTVKFDTNGGSSISDKTGVKWTDTVLSGITAPTKDGWEFIGWKCGDMTVNANTKYSDLAANDTAVSVRLVAQWKDIQKPIITGLENGKTYCDAVQFEVSDNDGIASVKAGNNTLTAGTNGKYTLEKGIGTVTVVVIDNAGNPAQVSVTVNNGHTAGNDDGDCSTPVYCIYHLYTVVVAAKSHDFSGEWHNDGTGHWHVCQNDGCTVSETETPHSGTDDGDCTTAVICGCGYVITAANAEHSYGAWQSNGDGTHTRCCTVTGCNGFEDGNCEGGQASYFKKAVCDECNEAHGELLTDKTAPTGEISIGTNKWNSFLNTITFGLFFKDTQSVTVTAADNSYNHDGYTDDKAVKVAYYLYSGDTVLTKEDLASKEFTIYDGGFNINPDNKYVIYARLTDHAGNVTYISSEGVVLDASAPVISGVENGKTYCEAQTVTVMEEYIESVKVNGTAVTLDANNQFTLNPAEGTQTVVATDKAGNVSAEMTVTVNDGHTYEWQSANGKYWKKCKFCGDETAKKDIPTITIDGADAVCVTQDYKFSFTLPQDATNAVYGYEFENKGDDGLPAIIENNKLFGIVPATEYEPSENSFKVYAGAKTADGFEFFVSKTVALKSEHTDATPKDHICDICGATLSEHTGGEATCTNKAVCEYCGEEYGELDSTNHNLEKISAKAATVIETGNEEYWHCKDCEKYFADEKGTNEIKLDDTVISKLSPEIIEGKGQSITAGEKKELTFRSNAAFSDFILAQLDGKNLDEKYYTVKEGSTVVTLKSDYVATLSAGEHTIGIVSESGTATTTFTVNAKEVADNDTKSPQTGDNNHITFWIALFVVSGGAVATTVVSKKKKHGKH